MRDCFYMSNVCPQVRELNHVSWERLESACRRWAKKMGCIYIICGPVYWKKVPEYIGVSHRVAVPDGFFKVVLCLKNGKEKGIAFYYDNTDVSQPMRKAVRSIDQIEKMTRLDFTIRIITIKLNSPVPLIGESADTYSDVDNIGLPSLRGRGRGEASFILL